MLLISACSSSPESEVSEDTTSQSTSSTQSDEEGQETPQSEESAQEDAAEEDAAEENAAEENAVEEEVVEEESPEAEAEADEPALTDEEIDIDAILIDTYAWGTGTAAKTIVLQEALGIASDGSYGPGTRDAHLAALIERGLSVDNVPELPDEELADEELADEDISTPTTGDVQPEEPVDAPQDPVQQIAEGAWISNSSSPNCDWRGTGSCGFYHRSSDPDFPYVGPAGSSGAINPEEWGSAGEWAYNLNDGSCNFNGEGCGYFFTEVYDTYSIQSLVSAPSVPSNLRAGPENGLGIVAWSASTENGGIANVEYTVTASPGGATCVTDQTTCNIALTNGTDYTFTVAATNGVFSSAQSSPSSTITPGASSSVLLNLDGGDFAADVYSSGGIDLNWGNNTGSPYYFAHAFAHYYDIDGGNGHGGVAWPNRATERIDVSHNGECVKLSQFSLRVENDAVGFGPEEEYDENTVELVSASLNLYQGGILIGSQSTGLTLAQQTASAQTSVAVSAGSAGCVDRIEIVYNISGVCDLDQMSTPCIDQTSDAELRVMSDNWRFDKWG